MLSCVWHGVCTAVTEMSPILNVSPCFGVLVTPSQSLPPMMARSVSSSDSYFTRPVSNLFPTWGSIVSKLEGAERMYQFLVASGMVPVATSSIGISCPLQEHIDSVIREAHTGEC